MAKSWQEKFAKPAVVQIETIDKPFAGAPVGGRMAILTPALIDAALRQLLPGESTTVSEFRSQQARELEVDVVCPLTTGIFLRIVAEKSLEEMINGTPLNALAPFWRMVSPKDPLAKKLSCGPDWIAAQRAAEGIVDATAKPKRSG